MKIKGPTRIDSAVFVAAEADIGARDAVSCENRDLLEPAASHSASTVFRRPHHPSVVGALCRQ